MDRYLGMKERHLTIVLKWYEKLIETGTTPEDVEVAMEIGEFLSVEIPDKIKEEKKIEGA